MELRWLLNALRRAVVIALALTVALVVVIAIITRDEIAALRALNERAKPVPPALAQALLTNDPNLFAERRFTMRGLLPSTQNVARCAPTMAFLLVRTISPPRRAWRWHIETAVVTFVVAYTFTPDELLRTYAYAAYFGRVDGVNLYGIESASAAYFGRPARDLTTAEAATLAGILPSPIALSPFKDPSRAVKRRDGVLKLMLQTGSIREREYRAAVAQPLKLTSGAAVH